MELSCAPPADGLQHLEEVKLIRCVYIEDGCLERLSSTEVLQSSLSSLELVSCGNVSDKGLVALHKLGWAFTLTLQTYTDIYNFCNDCSQPFSNDVPSFISLKCVEYSRIQPREDENLKNKIL